MTPFARLPKRTTRRFLPGYASASRFSDETALPGVNREERMARRSVWTNIRADQRSSFGLRDNLGLVGAALVLALMLSVALTPQVNVLDTASARTTAPVVEAVETAPQVNTTAQPLKG